MKKFIYFLIILSMLGLVGCGKQTSYYQDTRVKHLKTFTSFCGKDPAKIEKQDAVTVYFYYLDNNADSVTAISQYEDYLKNDMGFISEPFNGMTSYKKDGDMIMELISYPYDSLMQYSLAIPLDMSDDEIHAALESRAEDNTASLDEIIKYNDDKEYQKAYDLFYNTDWGDNEKSARTEMLYAEAMLWYQNGMYGKALDMLERNCADMHEASTIITEIHEKVDSYTGTYLYNNPYCPYYLFIKDGVTRFGFDSDTKESELYYNEGGLIFNTDENGKETVIIGRPEELEYITEYRFEEKSDDKTKYIKHEEGSDQWDGGPYKKINDNPPAKKE